MCASENETPMNLRAYQQAAIDAVYDHLRHRDDNPCVVIPTGGGKTPVIATICRDAVRQWSGRVMILAHVRELLEQSADKLRAICPDVPFGVFSAGLGRKDYQQPVIIGGIQSVYKRAHEFDPFDLIIIDEAHMIPPDGDGMYRTFLDTARAVNPHVRVIGLTATPYRMKSGEICSPDGILNHVCYDIGVAQLVLDGYLCRVTTRAGRTTFDLSNVHISGGEFAAEEVEAAMDRGGLLWHAMVEVNTLTRERAGVLIFAPGVATAKRVATIMREEFGAECGIITGETPDAERRVTLERFRRQELRYLVNVNVLTTGFDATHIDAIVMLRATMSPGLYYQMVGRGFRVHPGKDHCLVLDFAGNVMRHGPVDEINTRVKRRAKSAGNPPSEAPAKTCPECQSVIAISAAQCPDCGHIFPAPEPKIETTPTTAPVLSMDKQVTHETYAVENVRYIPHRKKGWREGDPETLRVTYGTGWYKSVSEWVCFEHHGYARRKAEQWWAKRSKLPCPRTAEQAKRVADGIARCTHVTVKKVEGEYDQVVGHVLGEIPEPAQWMLDYLSEGQEFGEYEREPGEDEWGDIGVQVMPLEPSEIPF